MAAASRVRLSCLLVVLFVSYVCAADQVQIDEVAVSSTNVPREAVSQLLIESALNSLNERNAYKNSQLIEAQKLVKSPYVIYKLKLKLEPECVDTEKKACSGIEICSLNVRQHEQGVISVVGESIKCESEVKVAAVTEKEIIENLEKQVVKETAAPSFDSEVQMHEEQNYRPFVAVRANQSEYCPGCPYELNPSLPGLTAFSEQALRSMDEAAVSDFKHKLVSIVRVSRAVPANANLVRYQLLMEIAESNCLKSSHIELSECSTQSNLPIRLCLVSFEERPWRPDSRIITKNNCTEQLSTNDNEVSANLRPAKLGEASSEEDTTKQVEESASTIKPAEFFDQIAQEAQEVARVPSAQVFEKTENVEATDASEVPHSKPNFSADKLKEFDEFLQDFEPPVKFETTTIKDFGEPVDEEPMKKEQVATNNPKEGMTEERAEATTSEQAAAAFKEKSAVVVETVRIKRDLTQKPMENNKAMLRKLTVKAIELVDRQDEDDKRKHVIDIVDVKKERQDHNVVYYLTVEVAPTDCSEKDQSTECLDEVIPGPTEICKISVATSEKKPLQSPKLLHYDCKYKQKPENRFKRENTLGGRQPLSDPDDPKIKQFIELGLRQYSDNYQGTHEPMISKVRNVTVQVVSGLLYRIETDIGSSTCKKGEKLNCQLNTEKESKQCIIEAWSQAWVDKGNPKIKVKCDQDKREKRSLRGVNYSEKTLQQSRQLKEEKLFHAFVEKYKRKYESEEEKERRFNIFRENLNMIEELQRNEQGSGRYGVTQFADLTKAEFTANYLGLKPSLKSDNDIPLPMAEIPDIEIPENYDWRHHNAVTPVKNQGSCGSCWAFSVTGNVEGQYAIKHGKLLSLSEQELVDCDKLDSGCNGGLPDSAYRAIEELGGLELETDYPYEAEDEKCHFDKNKVRVSVVSGLNITSNETKMAQWLVKNGPMSIGINANAMQFYMGGVSHPFKFLCRSDVDSLDHGVLIVGYGVKTYPIFKKSMPYWLIKNSWGPHWGEQGYYRVYRGDGTCGVNQMVTSAVIA